MLAYLAPCIVHRASPIVHCASRIMGYRQANSPHLEEVAAVKTYIITQIYTDTFPHN